MDRMAHDPAAAGGEMYRLIEELYPICRSLTGAGFRQTLDVIARHVPLARREVPSGTPVLDWTVPPEWNVRDAYVKDARGERVIDFRHHNLHLVGYSVPIRERMSRAALDRHLHSLPDRPDWIPYRTTYYERTWGFCVSHRVRESLGEGEYEVCIDASLEPGHLTFGECMLEGASSDEILISCHACHPSLCNDNLSGIAVATLLARHLAASPRRHTFRLLFIPGTIGSITWLALNPEAAARTRHGLVITGVGDRGHLTYKRSRRGAADVDRAAAHVLRHRGEPFDVVDFSPYGYDERQYCSPGFDLPVGCLMRTPHGQYPEYHTSADDLSFVTPDSLAGTLGACVDLIAVLEGDRRYVNLHPRGEPQLGRRGLYSAIGGRPNPAAEQMAMLWVLNLSDGSRSLLDIAERSRLPFAAVAGAASLLQEHGLLVESDGSVRL